MKKDIYKIIALFFRLISLTTENEKEEKKLISDEEFIKAMNSKERVIAGSEVSLKMHALAQRALNITAEINNKYNPPEK